MASLAFANLYFRNRLWTDGWDNASDINKEKALAHAENELQTLGLETKLEADIYNKAVCEQALFLLNLGEEDRKRLVLKAQGVKEIRISGAISEVYVTEGAVYAPFVKKVMETNKYKIGEML